MKPILIERIDIVYIATDTPLNYKSFRLPLELWLA